MWDPYSARVIERAVDELYAKVPQQLKTSRSEEHIPDDLDHLELALCITGASNEDEVVIGYYFVNMKERVLTTNGEFIVRPLHDNSMPSFPLLIVILAHSVNHRARPKCTVLVREFSQMTLTFSN